jgi:geranylgeranyl diphosphate synthase, type II
VNALDDYLARSRDRVEEALDRCLPPASEPPVALHAAMRYAALSGGKRLRPALAFAAAEACGGAPERALPVACAVELVHSYSLVHDDLPAMDDDVERRGMPTVHVKFGEAIAILTGDALLALAFEVLAESQPAACAVQLVAHLGRAAGSRELVGGQVDDIGLEGAGGSLAAIVSIHRRKTAALFGFALVGGALSAGAPQARGERLARYAEHYGLAFQAADDLLDGDRSETSLLLVESQDAVRQRVEGHVREARRLLDDFGAAAAPLAALAEQLLERIR